MSDDVCVWILECNSEYSIWDTGCGKRFYFDDGSSLGDNGFGYCPYCGKELEEQELSNAIE